jgi:LDH2 family malate/lactate/ureidoglycolate dehydrogenase
LNNTVSVNCTIDRNNHVNYHGSVKESNVKLLSYYNIAITTKFTMALNIVRRYQNNMIENQKSTDNDDNNDRKRHGQTQFTNTENRKLMGVNIKAEQNRI